MNNKLFSTLLIVFFALGIGIFIMPQNEISFTEKRTMATNNDLQMKDLTEGSLTAKAENVMKDQFYLRDKLTGFYYRYKLMTGRLFNSGKGDISYSFLTDGVVETNDGYLIRELLFYDKEKEELARSKGYNITELAEKYPGVKVYVYFPTRLEETFENMIRGNYGTYPDYGMRYREGFISQLAPGINFDYLKLEDISDHQRYYYRSDSHWTHKGAYEGYKDIVAMINADFSIGEPKTIAEEICYDYEFHGNISSQIGHLGEADHICDYKLNDIGDYTLFVNGKPYDLDLVKEEYAASGNNSQYSDYDIYFGDNFFERVFDYSQLDRPNILIFADSFTNVYQEWLASHFNKTVILDLRARPGDFSLDNYVREYDIDIILIAQPYLDLFFNGDMFIPLN